MQYFYIIRYYDKTFRVITPAQADAIQKAFDTNAKYVRLGGDMIALSSIARIESAKYFALEMENFSPFGYPNTSDKTCRRLGFLPLSAYHAEEQLKEAQNARDNIKNAIMSRKQLIAEHDTSMEEYKANRAKHDELKEKGEHAEARKYDVNTPTSKEQLSEEIKMAEEIEQEETMFIEMVTKSVLSLPPPYHA
jgi:predicted GNAT family acetyltransferase